MAVEGEAASLDTRTRIFEEVVLSLLELNSNDASRVCDAALVFLYGSPDG